MAKRSELDHIASSVCESGAMCADTRPGHALHAVQLRLAAATPSQWVDALVVGVRRGGWVDAVTLGGTAVTVWNHGDLAAVVSAGQPIAVHAVYNVLSAGSRRFNVLSDAA